MDPDANLGELLALAKTLLAQYHEAGAVDPEDAQRLAELVEALNEWLTGGGFLPRRWASRSPKRTPAQRQDWEQSCLRRIALLRSALRATLDANNPDELRRDAVLLALREEDVLREEGPA